MKIFTPLKLLCFIGLHDWIYGFDTENRGCVKKCSRCNKEQNVDVKEIQKKAPEIFKQFQMYQKIGLIK